MFSGPRVPARVVVNAYDEFTYDHSVRKRYCTPVAFEFAVDYKPRHQAFVNGANIANRVPHKIFTSLNFNLFLDSSHTRSPGLKISFLTQRRKERRKDN